MNEEEQYRRARKRVKRKKGFYSHLAVYLAVNFALMVVSEGESFPVILFWGIGLVSHYLKTFGFPGRNKVLSPEWEEREIEKEMQRFRPMNNTYQDPAPVNDEELELKEFKKLRKEWDDSEFV